MKCSPHQLASFLAVAEKSSFSEAARVLGLSQPALSRTIRLLEQAIGARLFDRNTRNVKLTPVGAELKPIAERLNAEFGGEFGELARFVAGGRGRVTVAALPSIAAVLLPPAIAALRSERPDVDVLIQDGLSGSVLDAVLNGRAEIGLTVKPASSAELDYRPLLSDAFGLVCREDESLATSKTQPWSVFVGRAFIAMAPTSSVRVMTDLAFLRAGLAVKPLYQCAFLGTTGRLVAAGLGITALPRLTLPLTAASGLAWRSLTRPAMRRQMGTVTRTGRSLSPAAAIFLELIEAQAKQNLCA
jgi:LysR family carnitine catabolism transcriptional activator